MKLSMLPIRGTSDYLPKTEEIREFVRKTILETFSSFGFLPIKTPHLENLDLLLGSDGGDNLKLIFKILKRGEKLNLKKENIEENDLVDAGLRYDLTVPLVRFFCQNAEKLPKPFKAIQIGDVFRADRPQKGRLRQFTQCDIDILGQDDITAEIEILNVYSKTLLNLGFKNFTFKINNRKILNEFILNCGFNESQIPAILILLDKLDKIGADGIMKELIEGGFNKESAKKLVHALKDINANGISVLNKYGVSKSLVDEMNYLLKTVNDFSENKFKAVFDFGIIRGQGYYTGMIYELYCDGFNGACGGGGRYDNMVEKFSGRKTSAVGMSIGFERICLILEEQNFKVASKNKLVVIYKEEDNFADVLKLQNKLQKEKCEVAIAKKQNNFQNQLIKFKENGIESFVIFKTEEVEIKGI